MKSTFVDSEGGVLEYKVPHDPSLRSHIRYCVEPVVIMSAVQLIKNGKAITPAINEEGLLNEAEAHGKQFLIEKHGEALTYYESIKRNRASI